MARLVKMVRLLKLNKLTKNGDDLQELLNINPALLRLSKFAFIAAIMGHLMACAWFWISSLQEGGRGVRGGHSQVSTCDSGVRWWFCFCGSDPRAWVHRFNTINEDNATQYWTALYWTFATITVNCWLHVLQARGLTLTTRASGAGCADRGLR